MAERECWVKRYLHVAGPGELNMLRETKVKTRESRKKGGDTCTKGVQDRCVTRARSKA